MREYPSHLLVMPTKSGNGFIEGNEYEAWHEKNGLYYIMLHGNVKYIGYPDGSKSPHLWDGMHWNDAGTFRILAGEL